MNRWKVFVLVVLFLRLFYRLENFKLKSSSGENCSECSTESQRTECESIGGTWGGWVSAQREGRFPDIAGQRQNGPLCERMQSRKSQTRSCWNKIKKIHAWLQPFAHSIADKYLSRDPNPGPKSNRKQEKVSSLMERETPTVLYLMLPIYKSLFTLKSGSKSS